MTEVEKIKDKMLAFNPKLAKISDIDDEKLVVGRRDRQAAKEIYNSYIQ